MVEEVVDMVEEAAAISGAVFPAEAEGKPSAGVMDLAVVLLRFPGGDSMTDLITATFGVAMIGSSLGLEPGFMTRRGTGTILTMTRTMGMIILTMATTRTMLAIIPRPP